MAQQYKVFVSSTFLDLKDHRGHVIKSLQKAGLFVDPMEFWTASTDEPKEFSQARLEGCDLCILLVGFRRGYIPDGESHSITQLEYIEARKRGIGVLVFMLDEAAPWPRQFDELDNDPEIRNWRRELCENYGVEFFDNDPRSIDVQSAIVRWTNEMAKNQPAAESFLIQTINKIDIFLLEKTTGRISIRIVFQKLPIILLMTKDAKDGSEHKAPVIGVEDETDLILIADSYSESRYPVWYHNLLSNPNARVFLDGKRMRYTAKSVTRNEQSDYLAKATGRYSSLREKFKKDGENQPPILLLTEPSAERNYNQQR